MFTPSPLGFVSFWLPGFGYVHVSARVLRGECVGLLVESPGCFPEISAASWPFQTQPDDCLYLVEAPAPPEFLHEASILRLYNLPPRSFFFYSSMRFEYE